MSSETRSVDDGRDLERELENGATRGLVVDAKCVGCKCVVARRIPGRESLEEDSSSFRDVCPNCQRVTYWNPLRSLEGGSE